MVLKYICFCGYEVTSGFTSNNAQAVDPQETGRLFTSCLGIVGSHYCTPGLQSIGLVKQLYDCVTANIDYLEKLVCGVIRWDMYYISLVRTVN